MAKSDGTTPSSKRSKKASLERPSKKSKTESRRASTAVTASSLENAAAAAAPPDISVTIPRKNYKQQPNDGTPSSSSNKNDLPKIPKKVNVSKGDSLATIMPKKKDRGTPVPPPKPLKRSDSSRSVSSSKNELKRKETKSPLAGSAPLMVSPPKANIKKQLEEAASPAAKSTGAGTATTSKSAAPAGEPNEEADAPSAASSRPRDSSKADDSSHPPSGNASTSSSNDSNEKAEPASAPSPSPSPSTDPPDDAAPTPATTSKTPSKKASTSKSAPESADPPKKKKGRPPKIDTTSNPSTGADDKDETPAGITPAKSPASGGAQDQHPYARSSVIEVWHGVEDPSEDSWWTEDSDSESETEQQTISTRHHFKTRQGHKASVRLCDVIDRVPLGPTSGNKWRYYVHYRDFNRRMDEWVSMERIVSPPSVGNAKARALKLEEEKRKRKEARKEEKKEAVVDVSAPRASRRRSTSILDTTSTAAATTTTTTSTSTGTTPTSTTSAAGTPGAGASETPRQTRKQRRKSVDDDATVVMGNSSHESFRAAGENESSGTVMAAEKGIVALPTQAVHITAVGDHIVETIAAQELDEHEGLDEASLREHEEVTKVKNVAFIELGAYQMETWYFSPLPKELLSERGLIEVLYVCEFTLNLFSRKSELQRFQSRLAVHARHPPGNEIYRNGNLSMFEVDGFEERIYCQNLCYIAKLFLDHKTLYFDVDPFLFYVLCEVDERGFHPVGYYSKEKYSDVGYNLACILTFPCHQRKGYGRFLIAFSYELSKKEEKVGSPEKPMSDLGQQAYKPYWASTIVDFLLNRAPDASNMSIMDISKITSIMAEDIVFTLNQLGLLKIINGVYFVAAEKGLLESLAKKYPVKEPRVDPSKLHWSPFVTDVKRDKFSIHSKKPSVEGDDMRGSGGFP